LRKKIVGILICTLLIAAVFLPTVGSMNVLIKTSPDENPVLETFQTKCAFSGAGPNLDNWAVTPSIDLSDVISVHLEILTLYEIFYEGEDDYGYIKASDNGGSDWTILKTIQGYTPDWLTIRIDLQNWTDKNILIAFEFSTESDSISDGWWIQKIEVKESHEIIYYEDFSEYDINDPWGDWTISFMNEPPNASPYRPDISGETNGKVGTSYNYTFISSDQDFDDIFYYIKWGDGSPDVEWDGPHSSFASISVEHTFTSKGTYTIEAKAKDDQGDESKWGMLKVTINKNRNKQSTNSLFLRFLERLLDRILSSFSIFNRIIEFPVTR